MGKLHADPFASEHRNVGEKVTLTVIESSALRPTNAAMYRTSTHLKSLTDINTNPTAFCSFEQHDK